MVLQMKYLFTPLPLADMRDTNEERERQRNAWITVQRGSCSHDFQRAVNRVGIEEDRSGKAETTFGATAFWQVLRRISYEAPTNEEVNQIIDIDLKRSEDVWIWPFQHRRIDAYKELTKDSVTDFLPGTKTHCKSQHKNHKS